jgi:hypothetical protein
LLELLFTSGWLGIFLVLTIFWLIYKQLIFAIKLEDEQKSVYLTLMAILTTSVIFASITLPFFASYSVNIIALVLGTLFYFRKRG